MSITEGPTEVCDCGQGFHFKENLEAHKIGCQFAIEQRSGRWADAMKEYGFDPHPGRSVKENLAAFGDWWARRKAAGN